MKIYSKCGFVLQSIRLQSFIILPSLVLQSGGLKGQTFIGLSFTKYIGGWSLDLLPSTFFIRKRWMEEGLMAYPRQSVLSSGKRVDARAFVFSPLLSTKKKGEGPEA